MKEPVILTEDPTGWGSVPGRHLKKLLDFCKLLSTQIDYPSLLGIILQETGEILNADATSVILYDPGTDSLVFQGATGEVSASITKEALKRDEGIAGKCFVEGRPIVVNDIAREASFANRIDRSTGFQTRSVLAVPIRLQEETIGVLEIINKRSSGGFTDEDADLSMSVAGIIACAIERTRLIRDNLEKTRLAAIGETVAGLAHCIKNILNGLKGGAFIAQKGVDQKAPDKVARGWNIVGRNIDKITALVLDMLTYCKERKPEYSLANINDVIMDAVGLIKENAERRNIKIQLHLAGDFRASLFDPKGIHRCLLNLLSNAVDALSEKDGDRLIKVISRMECESISIMIVDNGCGMDEETAGRIFTSLFSTKGSKGTGLGLPVSQKIISEHGGTLTAASKPGQGTSFSLSIPLKTQKGGGHD